MGLVQLEFDLAVREWATKSAFTLRSSSKNQIVIQYVDGNTLAHWNEQDIEIAKTNILNSIQDIAFKHNVKYSIDFSDIGIGDLAATITITEMTRPDAAARYYDLLILGSRLTPEQFRELQVLKKKFGFV